MIYLYIYIYILESSAVLRAALILRGNRNRQGDRGESVGPAGREWRATGCGSWSRTFALVKFEG